MIFICVINFCYYYLVRIKSIFPALYNFTRPVTINSIELLGQLFSVGRFQNKRENNNASALPPLRTVNGFHSRYRSI
jgi:hypothetical protein